MGPFEKPSGHWESSWCREEEGAVPPLRCHNNEMTSELLCGPAELWPLWFPTAVSPHKADPRGRVGTASTIGRLDDEHRAINSPGAIVGPKMAVTMTPRQWEMGSNELESNIWGDLSSPGTGPTWKPFSGRLKLDALLNSAAESFGLSEWFRAESHSSSRQRRRQQPHTETLNTKPGGSCASPHTWLLLL